MVLMHANVLDAEKKQSRSVPTTRVVMADDKLGKRRRRKSLCQTEERRNEGLF